MLNGLKSEEPILMLESEKERTQPGSNKARRVSNDNARAQGYDISTVWSVVV